MCLSCRMAGDAVLTMLNRGKHLHCIDDSGSDTHEYDGDTAFGEVYTTSHTKANWGNSMHSANAAPSTSTGGSPKSASINTFGIETSTTSISAVDNYGLADDETEHETAAVVFLNAPEQWNSSVSRTNLDDAAAASSIIQKELFQFYKQRNNQSADPTADCMPEYVTKAANESRIDTDNNVDNLSDDDAASSVAPGTISRASASTTPNSFRRTLSSQASTSVASTTGSSDTLCDPNIMQEANGMRKTDAKSNVVNAFLANDDENPASTSTVLFNRFGFMIAKNDAPGTLRCLQCAERPLDAGKVREREKKWLAMLSNWELFMEKKFTKVRDRCRKGIPPLLRGRAWCHLCGAQFAMLDKPNLFVQLDASEGDPQWVDLIERDVHRQFPTHELFAERGGVGQTELFRLLKAYSVHQPKIGFCQAMAPVAATLLTQMPIQDAFYCFDAICSKHIAEYYSPGLVEVQTDEEISTELLKRISPHSIVNLASSCFVKDWVRGQTTFG